MRPARLLLGALLACAASVAHAQSDGTTVPWTSVDDTELGQVAFAPVQGLAPMDVVESRSQPEGNGIDENVKARLKDQEAKLEGEPEENEALACQAGGCNGGLPGVGLGGAPIPSAAGFGSPVGNTSAMSGGIPSSASQALQGVPVAVPVMGTAGR